MKGAAPGFGLGLRREHYAEVAAGASSADWFEVISENFMESGGQPLDYLMRVRRDYPVVLHGVSLSIGSVDPINWDYLAALAELADRIEPAWISDHLCWTGQGGVNTHDLLPLPYTEEALAHVVQRVSAVQDRLKRRIALENVSSYLRFPANGLTEWEFLDAVAAAADCLIVLDINNVYVNARNFGFDPLRFIGGINPARVQQIHLAGHTDHGSHLVDTHDAPVCPAVWDLYRRALQRCGAIATSIERDDQIPPLHVLDDELDVARRIAASALAGLAA